MRTEVEQALQTLREGEPGGVERALALLQDTVFSFSMKICGHRQDAEDTMQETLLKAVPYLHRFQSPKALAVWLYKVAKNRCLMSRRKSKFSPKEDLSLEALMPDRKELEQLVGTGRTTAETSLLRGESGKQLEQALLRLPAAYRIVLVLHDMEGLSTEEVAQVLGLREGTVRVRLHRARAFARNALARPLPESPQPRRRAQRVTPRCKQTFAALSDYLDGALDEPLCEELEKHLDGCPPCQAYLASLQQTIEELRTQTSPRPPQQAASRARQAVLAEYRQAMRKAIGKR